MSVWLPDEVDIHLMDMYKPTGSCMSVVLTDCACFWYLYSIGAASQSMTV